MSKDIQPDWAETLSGIGQERSVRSLESVFFQGEKQTAIGIVISGTAKAVIYSEDGQETWIEQFGPGEFFGHGAILSGADPELTIIAETQLTFLSIPISKFDLLLADEQSLPAALAKDLAYRLNKMTRRLVDAVTLSSRGRVCAELMRLSKPIGVSPDKSIVRPNPVFKHLALRVSSTRETVSRTVSDLQKKGILSREAGAILIHKPDALRSHVK